MMPAQAEPDLSSVYEKIRLDVQLSMQVQHIHDSLGWLSEHHHELPRRSKHNVQRAVEEHIDRLLMRIDVLTDRRRSNLRQLLMRPPQLPKNPTYDVWRNYVLQWLAIIERAMDVMDLSLTPIHGEYIWEDDFQAEVLDAPESLVPVKEGEDK